MIFFPIVPMEKYKHCAVWCPLYRLILVYLCEMLYLKPICAYDTESQFLKL